MRIALFILFFLLSYKLIERLGCVLATLILFTPIVVFILVFVLLCLIGQFYGVAG